MTSRDRIVVLVLAALALLAVGWVGVVSPERKRASEVESKVSEAQAALSSANAKLSEAKAAQRRYAAAYSTIVSLGEAVPADEQVPSLVYELDHASSHDKVEFQSISAGGSSSSASVAAGGAAASAGFRQLPFTLTFDGSFLDLYNLIDKLQSFTVGEPSGGVRVSGRLLTIDGLNLTVASGGAPQLTGTVTATAYVLPAGQGLTAGATPSEPGAQQPASAASSSGSGAAPAVVKAPAP